MQTCDVREQCLDALQEKVPTPLGKYKERGCGFENAGTVMFCPKRRRYLIANSLACPDCGSKEHKPYDADQLICAQCGTIFPKGE